MLKSLLSAALGAASLAAAAAAFLHFGDWVLLSPDDQMSIMMQINSTIAQAASIGYDMCKAGM